MDYVYLVRKGKHVRKNYQIYKIGMTTKGQTERIKKYGKGTETHLCINVLDSRVVERHIKIRFKSKFKPRPDKGSEYFEGNIEDMKKEFLDVVNEYNKIIGNNKIIEKNKIIVKNNKIIKNNESTQNPKYKCLSCKYETNNRKTWHYHINSKQHAKNTAVVPLVKETINIVPGIQNTQNIFICNFCKTSYSRLCNLSRHQQACKMKKLQDEINLLKEEKTNIEIRMLREKIDYMEKYNEQIIEKQKFENDKKQVI